MGSDDDLTRIEDLSDFLAAEDDEEVEGLETWESDEQISSQDATQPDIDISGLDEEEDDFSGGSDLDDLGDLGDFNSSDDTGEFNMNDSSFGDDEEDTGFGSEGSFGQEEESSFGDESGFGDDESSFGDDTGFGDDDSSFGDNSEFGVDDSGFGEVETESDYDNDSGFGDESDLDNEEGFETTSTELNDDPNEEFNDDQNQAFANEDDEKDEEIAEEDTEESTPTDDKEEITPVEKEEPKVAQPATASAEDAMKNVTIESHEVKKSEVKLDIDKTEIDVDLSSLTHMELKPISRAEFLEVKKFASNITYGDITSNANPPFSIILENVNNPDEAEDILSLLKQHKVLDDKSIEVAKGSLQRGHLLIPRISEYSAIYLANKLRRFDLNMKILLSATLNEDLDINDLGKVTSDSATQNKAIGFRLDGEDIDSINILITNKSEIENAEIVQFKDLISSIATVSAQDSRDDYVMAQVYNQLAKDLKRQAYESNCNAIVNVMFSSQQIGDTLKVICQGNTVIFEEIQETEEDEFNE